MIAFVFFALCAARARFFPEHKTSKGLVNGWAYDSIPPPHHVVPLLVALHPRDRAGLEEAFWAVSTPQSADFRNHLSLDEVTAAFSANQEDVDRVVAWIEGSGARVTKVSAGRDYVHVEAPVKAAETLLATEFMVLKNQGKSIVRALKPYSIPKELQNVVQVVFGVHTMPNLDAKKVSVRPASADAAAAIVGPNDLIKRYNVTMMGSNPRNSQAVAEFQDQNMAQSDLDMFFAKFQPDNPKQKVAGYRPPGSNNPNDPGMEASLDIQYIAGVGRNITNYFYADSSFDFWGGLASWAARLASESDCPFVHSVSYGQQAAEGKPTKASQDSFNTQFMKLGLRGITIVFASGDSGSGCNLCVYLEPSFPATSPYVLSVGATQLGNLAGHTTEVAVTRFGSGGGFSWDFPQPKYQQKAVQRFLKQNEGDLPYAFEFNRNGRATPDVSFAGDGFQVVVSGEVSIIGGTSASAPSFAALLSLLNDVLLTKSGKTLGFVNPWIYQVADTVPDAFFDVVVGGSRDGCCISGWLCKPGYDLVTGVGTPNFKELIKHI